MNRKTKVILALAAIFAAGAVTGGFGSLALLEKRQIRRISSEQIAPRQIERLQRRLQLTPEQRQKIQPIILKHSAELAKARANAHRASAAIIERMETSVAAELTPAQVALLQKMRAEERARVQEILEGKRPAGKPAPKADPKKAPKKKPDAKAKSEKAKGEKPKRDPQKPPAKKPRPQPAPDATPDAAPPASPAAPDADIPVIEIPSVQPPPA
ncbi:MAG: hypothetical protein LBR12_04725 [Opitutaceae bacterium]|jgi:hypothetical protein|nr:hypothetical protein [Opitutaceae bacterium]